MEYSRRLKLMKSRILNPACEIELGALDDTVIDPDEELGGSYSEMQHGGSMSEINPKEESSPLYAAKSHVSCYNRLRSKNILGGTTESDIGLLKGSKRNLLRAQSRTQLSDRSAGSATSLASRRKPTLPLLYNVNSEALMSPTKMNDNSCAKFQVQGIPDIGTPLTQSSSSVSTLNQSVRECIPRPSLTEKSGDQHVSDVDEICGSLRNNSITEHQEEQEQELLLKALEVSIREFKEKVIEPEEEERRLIQQALEASMHDFAPNGSLKKVDHSPNPRNRDNSKGYVVPDVDMSGSMNSISHMFPSMDNMPPSEGFQKIDLEYSQRYLDYNGFASTDDVGLIDSVKKLDETLVKKGLLDVETHGVYADSRHRAKGSFADQRNYEDYARPHDVHPTVDDVRSPFRNYLSLHKEVEESCFQGSSYQALQVGTSSVRQEPLRTPSSCGQIRSTRVSMSSPANGLTAPSYHSGAKSKNYDQREIQVSPGCYLSLYGSQETKEALYKMAVRGERYCRDLVRLCECLSCSKKLYCLSKASAVVCYNCHEISPVSFPNVQPVTDGNGGGVGLGIPERTYVVIQNELAAKYGQETTKTQQAYSGPQAIDRSIIF